VDKLNIDGKTKIFAKISEYFLKKLIHTKYRKNLEIVKGLSFMAFLPSQLAYLSHFYN
jgi:hypothetical protein